MASQKRPLPEATRELLAKKPRLANEPLDSQRSLECLTETTKRNATDSPLLHLPGEIRNKIWEYASSGEVELHQHAGRMLFPRKHDALPAFHLPRVCRQIYGETARLAYSLSIFAFPCNLKCNACPVYGTFGKWNLQENRDAIAAIEPNAVYIQEYFWLDSVFEFIGSSHFHYKKGQLRDTYPSLRCIYVSKSAMEYSIEARKSLRMTELLGRLGPENLKQFKRLIERKIKYVEGKDIKVIFGD